MPDAMMQRLVQPAVLLVALATGGVGALRAPSPVSRRAVLSSIAAVTTLRPPTAATAAGGDTMASGMMDIVMADDVPPGAAQAWRQYWPQLQLAGDFYTFELLPQVKNPQRWDLIGSLMESKSIGSAQSPSKMEREFISPMRVLSLAFPPDLGGEDMQAALNDFQRSMFQLGRAAGSSSGSLAAPSDKELKRALELWDQGRVSLNRFYTVLNDATGAKKFTTIPAKGEGYPRSERLYTQLNKDAALCRNRGGEALAGLWGNLMVYGTVPGVNPCGTVNMATYFSQ
jgi:hypothetical protein